MTSKANSNSSVYYKILTLVLIITTVGLGFQNYQSKDLLKEKNALIDSLRTTNNKVDKTICELHYFSNMTTKDTFKIKMQGLDILTSDINFSIISNSGEIIFTHNFKSTDLIGYGLIGFDTTTTIQKENYILKRFYSFLDESNFNKPAIAQDLKLDNEFYNTDYFDQIKDQNDCYSFYYLLGEEYMRKIVYLRKEKKTIEFWSCC